MTDLAALVVRMQADNSDLVKKLDQATQKLNKFSKDTKDGLKDIAAEIGAAFTIDKLVEFEAQTIEASAELSKLSQSTGIGVEQLSALQFAFQVGGVQGDALATSMKKLNVAISKAAGDANSEAAIAFQTLGINVRNANGSLKDAATVNAEVADKFAGSADGANKVALAVALFGRAGEAMIPTLNKGSAGLKELADQANAAGAVISGPTAEAAEKFETKIHLLQATFGGIFKTVEANLLPVLNTLASNFLTTATNSDKLAVAAEGVTTFFKLMISAGTIVAGVFSEIGDIIGGTVAAITAAGPALARIAVGFATTGVAGGIAATAFESANGSFKETSTILGDLAHHAGKSASDTIDSLVTTWQSTAPKFEKAVDDTASKAKKSLGSLEGAVKLNAALLEFEKYAHGLTDAAAKTDQGALAAERYKVAHLELSSAILASTRGQAAFGEALRAVTATELQEVQKPLADLAEQLKNFAGDTANAGLTKYNESVRDLGVKLADLATSQDANAQATARQGQAAIDAARQQTVYLDAANVLATARGRIEDDANKAQQAAQADYLNGKTTELAMDAAINKILVDEHNALEGVANAYGDIAKQSKNPAILQQSKDLNANLLQIQSTEDALTKQVRGDLEKAFADNFQKLITGAESFKDAFKGMIKSIENDLASIVSKNISEQIFGTTGPAGGAAGGLASLLGGSGSSGGGIAALASLFGGGSSSSTGISSADFNAATDAVSGNTSSVLDAALGALGTYADGGQIRRGSYGIVGESGPELAYAGSKNMTIAPMSSGNGGVTQHINFTIQAPGGTISRQSQSQAAAALGRTASMAQRRNG